jgi:ubiquinone biosynthesis protein
LSPTTEPCDNERNRHFALREGLVLGVDTAPRHIGRYRHLGRYRQITQTLARYGFGYLVAQLGFRRFLPFHRKALSTGEIGGPIHLRLALQDLGATFIKLGQLLSTRADLLPPEYIEELSKLQDALPPVGYEVIAQTIEEELGVSPETLFADFDREPIAAASTSQVHLARLTTGEAVAVKVQRPGVASLFETDLDILRDVARLASSRNVLGQQYDFVGIADEMAVTLRPSLNYRKEARNIDRFRAVFAEEDTLYIPMVYHQYSTARVITMERVSGVKINDLQALQGLGIDHHSLAVRSVQLLFKMVFENGLFHADPHPGNFFVMPDGRLGVIDFGLVGHIGTATRDELGQLLVAVVSKDASRVVESLTELGMLNNLRERAALERDIERLLEEYYELPLGDIRFGQLLSDTMRVARRRGLQLPTSLALLVTVIAANEGMGRTLDPHFRLLEAAKPYAEHLVRQTYSPQAVMARLRDATIQLVDVTPRVPRQVHNVLRLFERGNVKVAVASEQIDELAHQVTAAANRVSLSMIAASFVIALAILLAAFQPAPFGQLAGVILVLGFLVASALGLWLFISILRS